MAIVACLRTGFVRLRVAIIESRVLQLTGAAAHCGRFECIYRQASANFRLQRIECIDMLLPVTTVLVFSTCRESQTQPDSNLAAGCSAAATAH